MAAIVVGKSRPKVVNSREYRKPAKITIPKPRKPKKHCLITVPQLRILKALLPHGKVKPLLTRQKLCKACDFSVISGTFSRAMNGVGKKSAVAEFTGARKGLLTFKYVVTSNLSVDGSPEMCYQITKAGIKALDTELETRTLDKKRNKAASVNKRYIGKPKAPKRKQVKKAKVKVAKPKPESKPVENVPQETQTAA